ncbi:MAG: transporter substrate-binding domain-containing protein [Anaerolineae bacterium]
MRYLFFALIVITCLSLSVNAQSGDDQPVPTLVPPTPLPVEPTEAPDSVLAQSTIARLQESGVLRVGVLYNEIPFGEYTIRGEVTGFDADLARLLAETWQLELELVQVTRQNQFERLTDGTVDLLLSAVVHQRQLDAQFEFSHSYRVGAQVVMVETDSPIASVFNLGGQSVGYVVGTEGESALNDWVQRSGVALQMRPYLTYDRLLAGLFGGEVVAIAGRDTRLLRTAFNALDAVEILDTPLRQEPFGAVLLRQDVHFRNLINRTLQYLASDAEIGQQSTLEQLHTSYFPNDSFPYAALPIYRNVGDEAPQPAQFPTGVPLPPTYVAPRILAEGVVRVAGISSDPNVLPPEQMMVATVNQALIEQMAQRWEVSVQYVEGDPIQAVSTGQADLAIGIAPDWESAASVDFSQVYVQHGRRLLHPANRDLDQFGDLRTTSRIVATLTSESDAQELAEAWADYVGIFNLRFFGTTLDDAAENILENNNALVLFGDSFSLVWIARQNPDFAIGPTWYDRRFLAFAVPQNDIDFRRLVNYTLQEMVRDQSLSDIIASILPEGERAPEIGIWTGSSEYLGLSLRR